jgi:8-oxo-dGTP diphosphatase/putative hydrolase of the HAD superfamily
MWKYWEVSNEDERADYEVDDLSEVLELFDKKMCHERIDHFQAF